MAPTENAESAEHAESTGKKIPITIRNPLTGKRMQDEFDTVAHPNYAVAKKIVEVNETDIMERKPLSFFALENEGDSVYISAKGGVEVNEFLPRYTIPYAFQEEQADLGIVKFFWTPGVGIPGEEGNEFRKAYWDYIKALIKEQQDREGSSEESSERTEKVKSLLHGVDTSVQDAEEAAEQLKPEVKDVEMLYSIVDTGSGIQIDHARDECFSEKSVLTKSEVHEGYEVKLSDGHTWQLEPVDENTLAYKDHEGRIVAEEIIETKEWGFVGMVELKVKDEFKQVIGPGGAEVAEDFLVSVWIARIAAKVGKLVVKASE